MDDPLGFLTTAEVGTLLFVATGAAVACSRLFPRLTTEVATRGIVSLQLAFTAARANAVVGSWRKQQLEGAARRSLLVDFPFIVSYAWALGLLAVIAGRAADASGRFDPMTADTTAAALAIAGWAAGFCDLVE